MEKNEIMADLLSLKTTMIMTNQKTIREDIEWGAFEYFLQLENEWQKSLPNLNERELMQVFPEAIDVISDKIEEWEEKSKEFSDTIKKKLILIRDQVSDENFKELLKGWVKWTDGQELIKAEKNIERLKRMLLIKKGKKPRGWLKEEDIQRALAVPIENLINQSFHKSNKTLIGLCPLHKEKNPSFHIYKETNQFWCYGCNQGGDVITFVRLLFGSSFREAVKYLIGI